MQTASKLRRRRWVALVASFATVVVTVMAGSSAARADEVYPVTSDGILHLHGHGWGHGHGMSQYGALGAANAGLKWPSILSFYYQGATQTAISNPTLRVNVPQVVHGGIMQVKRTTSLRLSWTGNTNTWASIGSDTRYPADAWRIRASGTGSVVEYHRPNTSSTTWSLYGPSPAGYAVFDDPTTGCGTAVPSGGTGCVTAQLWDGTQVAYRGQLRGVMSASTLVPVLALPMEDYLRSVVPSESPSYWPLDALAAQAVAARSYAENARRNPRSSLYDICDSTSCQVFSGTTVNGAPREYSSSDSAVTATAVNGGKVLTYGSSVIFAEFSSSNGGWSAYGGQPYLLARSDPYDATPSNPNHSWDASVAVTSIESRWPQIGTYLDLRITKRDGNGDWGGRVLSATVEGSTGSVTVTGTQFQAAFGLKSEWFVPYNPPSAPSFPRDVTGDGLADVLAVDSAGRLRIYPGNGSGGWQPTIVLGPGWGTLPKVFTAGTWDGDSVSDVMAQRSDGSLWLYPGTGAGSLSSPKQIGQGWQVHDTVFATGDFDGDGWSDLLARRASDGALFLYAGNGQGGFRTSYQVGWGWGAFTALLSPGDFDGDGHPDVLARAADGTLWLYPGNGTGGWLKPRPVGSGWSGFTSIISPGDFNGDGKPDVLARGSDGRLWLYPGNGAGGWGTPSVIGTAWNTMSTILP